MPRNGTGGYSLPQAPFSPGTVISSTAMNSDLSDIAAALTQSVSADGQTPLTSGLKFPSGSAGAPSVSFVTDNTTGMYYPGTKILGFSAGGAGAVQFNMNNVGTGQSGNVLNYTNGAVINPVGVVQDFAGSTAPTGWFLCFGQAVSRTGYPELFTVIGTTFGTGDGSTTFNLPDCRGRATFAVDNMGGTPANRLPGATAPGITGGNNNAAVTLTQANLPNVNFPVSGITLNDPTHTHTYTTDHAGGLNNQVIDTGNAANFTNQSGAINAASTGITIATQGSANSGGSGTPINALPPTIVFNKIIFAGRP